MSKVLLAVATMALPTYVAAVDYQDVAAKEPWRWSEKDASLVSSLERHLSDFGVEIIRPKEPEFNRLPLTVRLMDGERQVYQFQAHWETVFTRLGTRLYIAEF